MKKTPLRKISRNRGKELRLYTKLRKEYLDKNPICQRCYNSNAHHIHHTNQRFKSRLNNTLYFVGLCSSCHLWVHHNPKEAKECGYFV